MTGFRLDVPSLAPQLIGVIDLSAGRAVHAIAGRRELYADVPFCDGSPLGLAKHYQGLGIERLYIADLDAIGGKTIQTMTIGHLLNLGWKQVLIDVGWRGDEDSGERRKLAAIAELGANVCCIGATETSRSRNSLAGLSECVRPHPVMLGLDYQQQQLLTSESAETDWVNTAVATEACIGLLALEISAVGTQLGPSTTQICRRLRAIAPGLTLISGGGIRCSNDAIELLGAGCTAVLAATSLFPGGGLLALR